MIIYLHGFASSPGSFKAVEFGKALKARGIEFELPDLNEGDFSNITISRQLKLLERLTEGFPPKSLVLIGSSMGAYVSALFASRSELVSALVFMAPAFDFIRRWTERLEPQVLQDWQSSGSMEVMHYQFDRMLPLNWSLVEDARHYPAYPEVSAPTLIFHGTNDETVDYHCSEKFAADKPNVELKLLNSDHGLGDVTPLIIEQSLQFLAKWIPAD